MDGSVVCWSCRPCSSCWLGCGVVAPLDDALDAWAEGRSSKEEMSSLMIDERHSYTAVAGTSLCREDRIATRDQIPLEELTVKRRLIKATRPLVQDLIIRLTETQTRERSWLHVSDGR